jgi:hypothetical protein
MLIWQSNVPRFVIDEHVGDTITLYFGFTNIDDIELPEFYFIARLVKHGDRWSLNTRVRQIETNPLVPKPPIGTFTSKMLSAIKTGKDFNFREYFDNWCKECREFSIVITDTALPDVVPTRIWLRKYTQDNVNKG